jgi:hypothetical protein
MDPELDPDTLVRGTDPGIRIRTKMSRIPNPDFCCTAKSPLGCRAETRIRNSNPKPPYPKLILVTWRGPLESSSTP